MPSTFYVLSVLLLVVCLAAGHPEEESVPQSLEEAAVSGVSGEHLATTGTHLELEDPENWSMSAELEDETHDVNRRRRSTGQEEVVIPEGDLEGAESVVFSPHFLRAKKRTAHSECQTHNSNYALWSRQQSPHHVRHSPKVHCNGYCCYPLIPQSVHL